MKYFFMTAGAFAQCDYQWWQLLDGQKNLIEVNASDLPSIQPFTSLDAWLDGDPSSYSLLLWHNADNLFLFLSNLPTRRQDYQQRFIRNSVILFSENEKEMAIIRYLTVKAIELPLEVASVLDETLTESDITKTSEKSWFCFNLNIWQRYVENIQIGTYKKPERDWDKLDFRIAKDTDDRRKDICSYLAKQSDFSKQPEILVLITKYKSPDFYFEHYQKFGAVLTNLESSEDWRKKKRTLISSVKKILTSYWLPIVILMFFASAIIQNHLHY
ncbi:hypothetical protein HUU62_12010 [Rhodoferax sp. 4810]|uniref:Uncharacterized protein n=1 Tax=Thiospirillum jenense TaxID=1653858 RepID=A0A839HMU7_9GAMM|nr:hypothetical protein [Rhodoferax jenense]MBB1126782.1 hypothetical protein [Thiospirillum jenense]